MAGKALSNLAIVMGIVVILADLYWTYTSYSVPEWLALGLIILVASIVWLIADLKLRNG
ncbi:MAG: hypothetical protein QXR58_01290 [Candidatus Micrarchaeaceae archaeon]